MLPLFFNTLFLIISYFLRLPISFQTLFPQEQITWLLQRRVIAYGSSANCVDVKQGSSTPLCLAHSLLHSKTVSVLAFPNLALVCRRNCRRKFPSLFICFVQRRLAHGSTEFLSQSSGKDFRSGAVKCAVSWHTRAACHRLSACSSSQVLLSV